MSMILTKLSDPGWQKSFETETEVRDELLKYVCFQCRCEDGITDESELGDVLGTACGCEFWVD